MAKSLMGVAFGAKLAWKPRPSTTSFDNLQAATGEPIAIQTGTAGRTPSSKDSNQMHCPHCLRPFVWGETLVRFTAGQKDAFACPGCAECIFVNEALQHRPVFNAFRCWVLPLMLAGLPFELFGRSPIVASVLLLALIAWQLREIEQTHYDLATSKAQPNASQ